GAVSRQGAGRRVLDDPGEVAERGGRLGQARPLHGRRGDRDPPGVRGGGLPSRGPATPGRRARARDARGAAASAWWPSMMTKILAALAVIVIAFAAIVATRPSKYRVARTATIAAPAPVVFAQVNDFHMWKAWSPWAKLDPAMKQAYAGAPAGAGAIYTWAGNREVGEGRMTMAESRPNDVIRITLEFLKPFAATSTAEFTFKPQGEQTVVTWSMTGENNFIAKAVHLFMNMDTMIGGMFEKGLAALKTAAEPARGAAGGGK